MIFGMEEELILLLQGKSKSMVSGTMASSMDRLRFFTQMEIDL